jgi:hypothetical protein
MKDNQHEATSEKNILQMIADAGENGNGLNNNEIIHQSFELL